MSAPTCEYPGAKCSRVANFGMTTEPERYAIWLCEIHTPDWLADHGLSLQEVLCGNKHHTPASVSVPDVTGEFPALPTPFPNG